MPCAATLALVTLQTFGDSCFDSADEFVMMSQNGLTCSHWFENGMEWEREPPSPMLC
jgi:hypothetical protein